MRLRIDWAYFCRKPAWETLETLICHDVVFLESHSRIECPSKCYWCHHVTNCSQKDPWLYTVPHQHESLTEIAYHWLSFVDAIFSLLISIIGFYTYMSSMSIPIKPLQMIVSNNHRHRRIAYSYRHRQSRVEQVSAASGSMPKHRKGCASWTTHTLL